MSVRGVGIISRDLNPQHTTWKQGHVQTVKQKYTLKKASTRKKNELK